MQPCRCPLKRSDEPWTRSRKLDRVKGAAVGRRVLWMPPADRFIRGYFLSLFLLFICAAKSGVADAAGLTCLGLRASRLPLRTFLLISNSTFCPAPA